MQTLIHADIFFFITSVVTVLLGIFLVIILFYVLRIVRGVDHIVENIKKETDSVAADIELLRSSIREKGDSLLSFVLAISKFFLGRKSREKGRSKKD